MTSYRFCRPDDIPLLVEAVNRCYDVHFPDAERMTVELFRREMKELDLWPSNSMLALGGSGGDEPIAVSLATKREREVLVSRVGVRPDHLSRGHGRHLVTSLGQKLAVLGPPRLIAEVPRTLPVAEAFLAAVGFDEEAELADWRRPQGPTGVAEVPDELITQIDAAELLAAIPPVEDDAVAWERRRRTLVQQAERLGAAAIASLERVEAWVLYLPSDDGVEVMGAGTAPEAGGPERRELLLGLLLRWLAARTSGGMTLPKLAAGELPAGVLADLGFERGAEYARWAAEARPL